ncbi:hypothetical protein H7J88_16255 [Mycolicibacterium flavescens]|uniref:Cullin, a subunit of E3 ubiquitin ligase n=1 Tax=Mycolicibacterium flavescens TaxID=1776 RepID=A0A1E3RN45_MYCFV|nr:hypothetical protein [Mycolicibacterium flavescens]MCV7281194.1 hypothetical protein [Mycolicibacterium flavescens]ODQ91274.1 hypothetical protein BHQ18_07835 [Mycolicibacterium flavescens]
MEIPFIGSDAVADGRLTRAHLRSHYRPLYRGIYIPRHHQASLRERIAGVSLASPSAVVAGVAASAMHGAKWVEDDVPVELVAAVRRQRGLIVRDETLAEDEVTTVAGIRVTTPARTAFDLGRHLSRGRAVARMDALMNARPFAFEDLALLAKRHRGVRGLRRLRVALPLVDGGSESPRETWLRLLFIDAGLPRPTTQYVVRDEFGRYVRRIDMVWEDFKVGAEYDGEQHLTSRRQYVLDVQVRRTLQRLRWHVVHVIKEDAKADIIAQARDALLSRGWRP